MTRKLKKVLALLLTLSMVMSMVSVTSLAAEEGVPTLTYSANADGVTDVPDPQAADENGNVTISDYSGMKREGYTALGWSTDPEATAADSKFAPNETYVLTADTTLYAVWSEVEAPAAVAQTGGNVYPTLQEAINNAQDGATVTLLNSTTENVTITGKDITLDLFAKTLTGAGNGTVVTVNGGNVTLTGGGTITGGDGGYYGQGGGLYIKGNATVTMNDGLITDNHVRQQGGGVFIDEGTFTLASGSITNNTAGYSGGGVFVYNYVESKSALFIMDGGIISGNTANGGAGVGAFGWKMNNTRTVAKLNGGTIENNTAQNGGGVAMECGDAPSSAANYGHTGMNTIEVNGVLIRGNHANQGGGVWGGDSNLVINGTTISGNYADQGAQNYGGGVYVQGGSATISNAVITKNSANYGGGIYSGHKTKVTTVEMTSGQLFGNTAAGHSADVYNYKTAVITLPDASAMNVKLNGEKITGWFGDGNPRWDGTGDDRGTISALTGTQCLIAAYALPKHVTSFSITALYTPLTYMGEERLEAAKKAIENFDSLGITRVTSLDEDGWCQIDMPENNEVTLLFEIHVRGKVGMAYSVTSEGLTYVGGDPLEGTIPDRNPDATGRVSTTTYVIRHYTLEDIVVNQYGNWLGGSAIVVPGVELNEDSITVNESSTYREDWVKVILPKVYTVTYTDGVEDAEIFADQTVTVKEGESTPAFEGTPTREGYTFTGWAPEVAETVTGDVTYVAQWKLNEYIVTFDANGGSSVEGQTVKHGETAAEAVSSRNGYTFDGWYLDGEAYDFTTPVTKNITLVAQWTEDPSTPDPVYYTLTINYVNAEGSAVAPAYTSELRSGRSYNVASPAVEGMTPDRESVSGILNGDLIITVTYTAVEDVGNTDTPTTETPEVTETPDPVETREPDETQPPETGEPEEVEDLNETDTPLTEAPEETEELGEGETPLADVPQTGDMLWLWLLLAVGSAAGLVWISLEEKKGRRVAK